MMKAFKNIGFYLLVLIITGAVYWIVFMDKASKESTFDYALHLLGEDLLAMVPGRENRQPVKDMYDEFVERATENEIPPERIERIAASILNLSTMDTTLTPDEIRTLLDEALPEVITVPQVPAKVFIAKRNELGERIKALHEFNAGMQKSYDVKATEMRNHRIILSTHGLTLLMDEKFRERLNHEDVRQQLRKLEERHLLKWENDFAKEMKIIKIQLDSLRELPDLEAVESIPNLDIHVDSIEVIIRKNLEEAGIKEE